MFVQRRTGLAATGIVYYGPITEASISYAVDRLADTDCYNTGGVLHPEKRLVDLDAERVCFQYRHYFSYLTHFLSPAHSNYYIDVPNGGTYQLINETEMADGTRIPLLKQHSTK